MHFFIRTGISSRSRLLPIIEHGEACARGRKLCVCMHAADARRFGTHPRLLIALVTWYAEVRPRSMHACDRIIQSAQLCNECAMSAHTAGHM